MHYRKAMPLDEVLPHLEAGARPIARENRAMVWYKLARFEMAIHLHKVANEGTAGL